MSERPEDVSSKAPTDPSLAYLHPSNANRPPQKTCSVCNVTEAVNEEMLKLCSRCHESLDRYVHMRCVSKLEPYVSKNLITHKSWRKCSTPECETVVHLTYNQTTIDFPSYNKQRWLYYANPILWLLADIASLGFFIFFSECDNNGGHTVCYDLSFGMHGLAVAFYLAALFLKTTESTIYLELSESKRFAKQKIFTEMVLVAVSIVIGLTTFWLINRLNEVNPGFAIWIFVYAAFILPIVGTHFIHSHARLYSVIRSTVVELQPVSSLSNVRTQWLNM